MSAEHGLPPGKEPEGPAVRYQEFVNRSNPFDATIVLGEKSEGANYRRALNRMAKETTYYNEAKELGILDVLKDLKGSHTLNGSTVRWHVFNFLYYMADTSPDRKPHGDFDPVKKRVNIFFKRPSEQEVLRSMGNENIGEPIRGLLHEGIHAFQFPNRPITKSEARKIYKTKTNALREAQAFRFMLDHSFGRTIPTDELTEYVASYYGKAHGIRQIKSACTSIDQLHALGFSHLQIANLIQEEEGWDENSSSFPRIAAKIEALKVAKGITTDGQLNELIAKEVERKETERQKAIAIAQEETQRI